MDKSTRGWHPWQEIVTSCCSTYLCAAETQSVQSFSAAGLVCQSWLKMGHLKPSDTLKCKP